MEVVEPKPRSTGSVSAYDVHLMYEPIEGDTKYFKVDNMTNKVYLDNVRFVVQSHGVGMCMEC